MRSRGMLHVHAHVHVHVLGNVLGHVHVRVRVRVRCMPKRVPILSVLMYNHDACHVGAPSPRCDQRLTIILHHTPT